MSWCITESPKTRFQITSLFTVIGTLPEYCILYYMSGETMINVMRGQLFWTLPNAESIEISDLSCHVWVIIDDPWDKFLNKGRYSGAGYFRNNISQLSRPAYASGPILPIVSLKQRLLPAVVFRGNRSISSKIGQGTTVYLDKPHTR